MEKGRIIVIYGMGKGKSAGALGKGFGFLGNGKTVSIIQFLKGNREETMFEVLKKLEPDMKVFRFEKHMKKFSELSDAEKAEELKNIKNGTNFAHKVLATNSCDVLILDEILGLVDRGIMTAGELEDLLKCKPENMDVIVTGRILTENIREMADEVYRIDAE